jgi:hypothetical protein
MSGMAAAQKERNLLELIGNFAQTQEDIQSGRPTAIDGVKTLKLNANRLKLRPKKNVLNHPKLKMRRRSPRSPNQAPESKKRSKSIKDIFNHFYLSRDIRKAYQEAREKIWNLAFTRGEGYENLSLETTNALAKLAAIAETKITRAELTEMQETAGLKKKDP